MTYLPRCDSNTILVLDQKWDSSQHLMLALVPNSKVRVLVPSCVIFSISTLVSPANKLCSNLLGGPVGRFSEFATWQARPDPRSVGDPESDRGSVRHTA